MASSAAGGATGIVIVVVLGIAARANGHHTFHGGRWIVHFKHLAATLDDVFPYALVFISLRISISVDVALHHRIIIVTQAVSWHPA